MRGKRMKCMYENPQQINVVVFSVGWYFSSVKGSFTATVVCVFFV